MINLFIIITIILTIIIGTPTLFLAEKSAFHYLTNNIKYLTSMSKVKIIVKFIIETLIIIFLAAYLTLAIMSGLELIG